MRRTIFSMIADARARFGEKPFAFRKTDAGWTFKTFNETFDESRLLASFLMDRGYTPGERLAIYAEGSPNWIVAEYGIISAGCVAVPLSFKLLPEEIAYRLEHSEARVIFTNTNHFEKISRIAKDVSARTGVAIDLVSLDEEYDLAGTDYSSEHLFRMDRIREIGAAALSRTLPALDARERDCAEDEVVTISYTSGTTGNPKGIMLTHVNYWVNSHDAIELFQLPDAQFETLVVLPVDHSFAHTVGIYTSLLRGITLHFVDSRGSNAAIIRNFPKNLVELNPVFLMTVPSITGNFMKKMIQGIHQKGAFVEGIFNRGLEAGMLRNGDGFHKGGTWIRIKTWLPYTLANLLVFPKLRKVFGDRMLYCVGGGALLEAKQQRFFAAIGVPVFQGYGLTEAAPIISSNSPHLYKFGTSGMVAKSEICKIMVDETTEAKVGQRGEIVIKGENVMKGYFKNPAASAEVLRDGWLWTGDLGYYDEDGFLVVTGRAKALLINKDGEKYSPEEVEEVMINSLSVLNQLMVYNDHQMITTALVTLQEDVVTRMIEEKGCKSAEEALDMLVTELRSYEAQASAIPNMWLPSRFAIIEKPFSEADGLVNSTMKLVRYKTAEFYKDRIATLYESEEANRKANLEVIKQLFLK